MIGALGSSFLNVVVATAIFSSVLPLSLVYQVVGRTMDNLAQVDTPSFGEIRTPPSPVHLALHASVVLVPVAFALTVLIALLLESILSFLGVGLPIDWASLGGMMGLALMAQAKTGFWLWLLPFGIIAIAAMALAAVTIPISRVQQTFQAEIEGPTSTLEYAGTWLRFGSVVIDTLSVLVLGAIFGLLLSAAGFPDSLVILVLYVLVVLYSVVYLGGWKRSIGSSILRVQVVTAQGRPVTIWQSALRALVMGVPPAFLLIPFNRRRRALYDVLADTVVIRIPRT